MDNAGWLRLFKEVLGYNVKAAGHITPTIRDGNFVQLNTPGKSDSYSVIKVTGILMSH